jgi:hypothetical protein
MENEMAANKAYFDKKLVDLTQEIRASTESDTASTARPHIAEAQQTIVQPIEGIIADAPGVHPVAEMPQTGGSGETPGGSGVNTSYFQISAETVHGCVEVGNGHQNFATLRPEEANTFTGKPVELDDWLEAFHIYLALYGQTVDRIMHMVVNQFLSAEVKTWVKTLRTDSYVRRQKEMIEHYVEPLQKYRTFNSFNKLQQTGPVKDYSEKFYQRILKVVNKVTEKDTLRRYVEGLKDEIRTEICVGMVDVGCAIFAQVKCAAEALDSELWRSRRMTDTTGSSTTWQATKSTTGASTSGVACKISLSPAWADVARDCKTLA